MLPSLILSISLLGHGGVVYPHGGYANAYLTPYTSSYRALIVSPWGGIAIPWAIQAPRLPLPYYHAPYYRAPYYHAPAYHKPY